MIDCPLCTKICKNRQELDLHMVSHTKEKPHKCPICSAAFGLVENLKEHIKSVHDGIKRHVVYKQKSSRCPLCSYEGRSYTLKMHLLKHSAAKPLSCRIPNCGFKTKHKNYLRNHVARVHNGERRYECPSDGCSYKAKCRGSLKSHLSIHSNEKPFECQVPGCNYTCKKKPSLAVHTSRAHSDQKPFKCSTCDFRGKQRLDVRRHQNTHTKVKRYECQDPNCGYASSTKAVVQLHYDAKHRKKNISCTEPGCNYRCGSTLVLKTHIKNHKLPNLKCLADSCNFSTIFKSSLLKHISGQHQDLQSAAMVGSTILDEENAGPANALKTLNCSFPQCAFQTKFPHHYDRHRITHNEDENRKHVCTFCFSRFRSLQNLQYHLQRHIGEKPFRCSRCQYSTVFSSELRDHAERVHDIYVRVGVKDINARICGTCNMTLWSYNEFVLHSMSHLQPVVVLEKMKLHII